MQIIKNILSILSVIVASFLVEYHRGELDFPNYFLSKVSLLLVRNVYPNLIGIKDYNSVESRTAVDRYRKMMNIAGSVNDKRVVKEIITLELVNNITIRLYVPHHSINITSVSASLLLPTIVWIHGGGFVLGSVDSDDMKCMSLCNRTSSIVASIGYRLAPEHPFPYAFLDVSYALQWMLHDNNIQEYGGDVNKIIIAGESAGGNLAAALMASHIDEGNKRNKMSKIKGLILIYPCLEHGILRESAFKYKDVNGILTLNQMMWFWNLYLPDQRVCATDYRACPFNTPDSILRQFPKTHIILAKYDVLLDEGLEFSAKLAALGVDSKYTLFTSVVHGFFAMPGVMSGKASIDTFMSSVQYMLG